ncbi:hypothetical protein C3L33_00395, partial [Rhododendron williamsianum]
MAASGSSQPQFISSTGNRNPSNVPLIENEEYDQILVPDKKSWRNLFAYMGPGFLVSIAYIDPGNFATDLQAGSQYKYGLLWIILVASCAALIIQSLAANLGVVTGKHLAEHCRAEYSKVPNFILWILAESAIVACDIPEVLKGICYTAFPLELGGPSDWNSLCSKYALQNSSMVWCSSDRVEYIDSTGIAAIRAACFFMELGYAKPNASEVLNGLFVPQLKGNGATGLAISLLGAMVMPHNLFLHSALVLSRKVPRSVNGIKDACRFYLIESSFALMVAFLINLSVISVSGSVCYSTNLNPDDEKNCQDLDLNKASFLLKACSWSSKLFAIALLASGQSSTITGTYAGQYVMQISATTWFIGSLIMGINIYYLATSFVKVLLHSHIKVVGKVFCGILGFSGMLVYLAAIAYLVFRRNKEATHILALTSTESRGMGNELGGCLPREDIISMQLPQRRATVDVE